MRRRDFIRSLLSLPALATLPGGLARAAPATTTGNTLVVVFQRGGCDGLNTVVPYGDPNYKTLRPTIAIPAPGTPGATAPSAVDLNGFFGLHPALAPLADVYAAGELAVMPAVHYQDASRSHFDSQSYIESGATHSEPDGWLNRYLSTVSLGGILQAAAFGNQLPHSLRGEVAVSTISELGSGLGLDPGYEDRLQSDLRRVYEQGASGNRGLLHQAGLTALELLAASAGLDPDDYSPQYGAVYPQSGFGRQLAQAAQLIKANLGAGVITLDIGGWDTHSNQGGAQANGQQAVRHADFAGGLAAFHKDLGDHRNQVLVLTMTEFGRTALENASRGTDHGKAGAWFALGSLRGGIHGGWPGLAPGQLADGRFLDHTLDFRDLMAEVLLHHLGASDTALALPGHTYQPVGFL